MPASPQGVGTVPTVETAELFKLAEYVLLQLAQHLAAQTPHRDIRINLVITGS